MQSEVSLKEVSMVPTALAGQEAHFQSPASGSALPGSALPPGTGRGAAPGARARLRQRRPSASVAVLFQTLCLWASCLARVGTSLLL